MVALHKDVNSMAEGCAVSIICVPQRGLLQKAAPLCIPPHPLVLQPADTPVHSSASRTDTFCSMNYYLCSTAFSQFTEQGWFQGTLCAGRFIVQDDQMAQETQGGRLFHNRKSGMGTIT